MSGQIYLRGLEVFDDLRAALCRFDKQTRLALAEAEPSIRQNWEWLQERVDHCERAVERANTDLESAQSDLRACESGGYEDAEGDWIEPDCTSESAAVSTAAAELAECEARLTKAKYWHDSCEILIAHYRNAADVFASNRASDVPKALAFVDAQRAGYEAVLSVRGPRSTGTAAVPDLHSLGSKSHLNSSAPEGAIPESATLDQKKPVRTVDEMLDFLRKDRPPSEALAGMALAPQERAPLVVFSDPSLEAWAGEARTFVSALLHQSNNPIFGCVATWGDISDPGAYEPASCSILLNREILKRADEKYAIGTVIHEIGHHLEAHSPGMLQKTRKFLLSRILPNEEPQTMNDLTGGTRYEPDDFGIKDSWETRGGSPYCGRFYSLTGDPKDAYATEILSMGIQRLYNNPDSFVREDIDYARFIISALRQRI